MALKERIFPTPDDVLRAIDENLPNLRHYRNLDPKDRSREMQKAAFGDDAIEVTKAEYKDLIGFVRRLRPWLKINGKKKDDDPSYQDTDHEIYWLAETNQGVTHSISYEPKPWEQSAGIFREPYPKFSLCLADESRLIDFNINFDDTYNLTIKNKEKQVSFEVSGLRRKHMTANEYQVVKYAIAVVTSHFGIPVQIAA